MRRTLVEISEAQEVVLGIELEEERVEALGRVVDGLSRGVRVSSGET